jgi:hypothetical protein
MVAKKLSWRALGRKRRVLRLLDDCFEVYVGHAACAGAKLPSVGDVTVRSEPNQGLAIRDRATARWPLFLSGIQAGACLSFLKANPKPSRKGMRAACPGEPAGLP